MKFSMPTMADIQKQRLSLILAGVTLVFLLIVHFVWIAPTMAQKEDLGAKVRQQEEIAKKYQEKLAQAESIRENLARQEQEMKEMQKHLFRGTDPYQLAASLGEYISSKGAEKIDMKTYQVLASKEYGLYQEVHLRFNFMTSIQGLHFFLNRIEAYQAAVLVQEINVQKIQRKGGPDLVVNVVLMALMEKGEKA